jgi:crossover junction endodeoxyribonuclease RuvC
MFEPMFGSAGLAGVVLGIDPGVSRCGYGAVAADGNSLVALACGVIRTPPSDPLPDRLAALQFELEGLVADLAPAAVAVERVFFQTNVRTAMSVGQASGLALAVAARAGIPVCQYTPNEVKQAVAGYGAAGKEQVQAMVTRLLSLAEVPKPPDAADALALAICHLSAGRFRTAAGLAGGDRSGTAPSGPLPALARAIAAADGRAAASPTRWGGTIPPTRVIDGAGRPTPTPPRPSVPGRGRRGKESL